MRTKPVRWVAIHFSEAARDRRWPNAQRIWKEVVWPSLGPFEALCRARLPVAYVSDAQLEAGQLEGYKVLVLPTPKELTAAQQKAVEQFRGAVIEMDANIYFDNPNEHDQQVKAFLAHVRGAASQPPIEVTGGPAKMHAVAWKKTSGEATVINLVNDFSWVSFEGRRGKSMKDSPNLIRKPTAPARGAAAILRTNQTPKKVFEAVSGTTLTPEKTSEGWRVAVPEFPYMAAIVFQW
jgi:hypothetical protein